MFYIFLTCRESIWHYNTADNRAFLAQRSKPNAKFMAKVAKASEPHCLWLLTALEHLKRKTFRLIKTISGIGRGLEKS